ncbi:Oxidoreductase BOA17 [Paramyrothecium foliicola]|nr:Oxidoreductase BOA17 [Paramyrothecium foliicola]
MARVWFVTGSARGLGRSIVEAVLASGDSVVATARKSEQLNDLVQQYGSDRVLAANLDVADYEQAIRVVELAVQKFGRVDVLVNNAGYAVPAAIEDTDMDLFRAQTDANFFGTVHVTKAVLPVMRKQQAGRIIQISSIGSRISGPGLAAYQSAKWAVTGFSQSLAVEVAPFNIKITVLEPGGMQTDMAGAFSDLSRVTEPYKQTVGGVFQAILAGSSKWTETTKVAETIIKLSNTDEPPTRVLLGRDTVEPCKMAAETLAASDEKWRHLTTLSSEGSE